MKMVGKSQNCQLKSTRHRTERSQECFLERPSRVAACSFSSAVRNHACLCLGRSGMKNQPGGQESVIIFRLLSELEERGFSPNNAIGIVVTETTMKINRQAGRPPFPDSDPRRPAWIQPPAMFPILPNPQKMAALLPSSDCLYQDA